MKAVVLTQMGEQETNTFTEVTNHAQTCNITWPETFSEDSMKLIHRLPVRTPSTTKFERTHDTMWLVKSFSADVFTMWTRERTGPCVTNDTCFCFFVVHRQAMPATEVLTCSWQHWQPHVHYCCEQAISKDCIFWSLIVPNSYVSCKFFLCGEPSPKVCFLSSEPDSCLSKLVVYP